MIDSHLTQSLAIFVGGTSYTVIVLIGALTLETIHNVKCGFGLQPEQRCNQPE